MDAIPYSCRCGKLPFGTTWTFSSDHAKRFGRRWFPHLSSPRPDRPDERQVILDAGSIELTFDDVIRNADDFTAALLVVSNCQEQTAALSYAHGVLDRTAWPAEARAKVAIIGDEFRRAWEIVRK